MAIILPVAVGFAAGTQADLMMRDGLDQLRQGGPNYLRDGDPDSVAGKIGQAVGRSACRRYAVGNVGLTPEKAERYERACRPYLEEAGYGPGPGVFQPFKNGQCACSVYRLQYTISGTSDQFGTPFTPITGDFRVRGPVSALRQVNGAGFLYSHRGRATFSSGATPVCASSAVNSSTGPAFSSSDAKVVQTLTLISGPDNCGGPEPVGENTDREPDPTGNPFRFNPAPNIDVDINTVVNVDGTVTFNIGTGPIKIDPFNRDTGRKDDPGGGDGGGGGGGDPTPEPGTPGSPSDTGAGSGGADGDAPEGKVLTGVRLDILEFPGSRSRFTDEVDRGVAYVYMGAPVEGLGLEPTGSLVRTGQFFFAQKDYLTRHSVRANLGYNIRVTPYYRDKVA